MKVVSNDKKKVLWEVVDNHVVEEPTDHDEIGLLGFDLNVSKSLSVFQKWILEEKLLSRFSSYIWSWGVKAVG